METGIHNPWVVKDIEYNVYALYCLKKYEWRVSFGRLVL